MDTKKWSANTRKKNAGRKVSTGGVGYEVHFNYRYQF